MRIDYKTEMLTGLIKIAQTTYLNQDKDFRAIHGSLKCIGVNIEEMTLDKILRTCIMVLGKDEEPRLSDLVELMDKTNKDYVNYPTFKGSDK